MLINILNFNIPNITTTKWHYLRYLDLAGQIGKLNQWEKSKGYTKWANAVCNYLHKVNGCKLVCRTAFNKINWTRSSLKVQLSSFFVFCFLAAPATLKVTKTDPHPHPQAQDSLLCQPERPFMNSQIKYQLLVFCHGRTISWPPKYTSSVHRLTVFRQT